VLDDSRGATVSRRAIKDLIQAVRTGAPRSPAGLTKQRPTPRRKEAIQPDLAPPLSAPSDRPERDTGIGCTCAPQDHKWVETRHIADGMSDEFCDVRRTTAGGETDSLLANHSAPEEGAHPC
jgi:hypothetical protein